MILLQKKKKIKKHKQRHRNHPIQNLSLCTPKISWGGPWDHPLLLALPFGNMLPFYSVPSGAVDPEFVSAAGCFSCSSPTAEFITGSVSTHVLWTQDCSKVCSVVREHSDTLVQLLWQDEKRIHLIKHVCSRKYQCFPESRANDKTFPWTWSYTQVCEL